MEYQDYYHILGVDRTAQTDEIKRAYRKLARKFHPDISKEADAETRMQSINEAWAVLSDPEKRAAYDQLGNNYHPGQDFRPPPGWDAGFAYSGHGAQHFSGGQQDFSDFFSSLFGDAGHAPQHRQRRTQGKDLHTRILVDLEDALQGGDCRVDLRIPMQDEYGHTQMRQRSLNVSIPQGIRAGQQIRLSAQGNPSSSGGPNGDLFLEIQFRPHPRYRVEGGDIYVTVAVTPWEMALGAKINVETPAGRLEVRVPEASRNGRKLRMKGRGLPGNPNGDLYLVLEVELPPANTARARELYETMARDLAFTPKR